MLARIIFGLLTLISIVWIAVSSHMQHQQTTQFKLEELFGPQDQEIIIVNQFDQLELITENEPGKLNWGIFSENASELIERVYFSKTQDHALILTQEIVTKEILKALFQTEVKIDKNNFATDKYNGHFNQTNIYIYKSNVKKNTSEWALPALDKNAFSNVIQFQGNTVEVQDLYQRKEGPQFFTSTTYSAKFTAPINDAELFAHILSNQIGDYQFFAKSNANAFEANASKQIWMDLTESGFVVTTINQQPGIYLDARPNTNIYQLTKNQANDGAQIITFETSEESTFFHNRKTLYIGNLDDHYVISPSKSFCEEAIAHYKLGNVLHTNPSKMQRIFSSLPRKVHQRTINKDQQMAIRLINGQKLTFEKRTGKRTKVEETPIDNEPASLESKHFNIGADIKWAALDASGRIALFDEDRTAHFYGLNGKILSSPTPFEISPIIHFINRNASEQLLSIRTTNRITLYNPTGTVAFQLEPNGNYHLLSDVAFIRVKNKDYVLVGGSDGVVYWHNATNGKVEKQTRILAGREIAHVQSWISNGKPFFGVWVNGSFYLLNAETQKVVRSFGVNGFVAGNVENNDFKQVIIDRGQIKVINQRGNAISVAGTAGVTEVRIIKNNPNHFVAFDGKNRFVIFNLSGEVLLNRTIANQTIDQFDCTIGASQAVIIACLDELNNTIQMYNLSTEQLINNTPLSGSRKVLVHANGKSVFLYTLIDNILIRYDQ